MSEARYTPDAQRYLDGGPHGGLEPAEQDSADALLRAAAAYRDALGEPDPGLDRRVMGAVRSRAPHEPRAGLWGRLARARVRPVWIPLAAAAAALTVWFAGPRRSAPVAPAQPAVAFGRDTVFVRFELAAPLAHSASVAGSFNAWDPGALPMARGASGVWTVTIPLPVGEHQYQFVVDGARWEPDPSAHAQVDDGFGGTNSVIVVGPKGLVRT